MPDLGILWMFPQELVHTVNSIPRSLPSLLSVPYQMIRDIINRWAWLCEEHSLMLFTSSMLDMGVLQDILGFPNVSRDTGCQEFLRQTTTIQVKISCVWHITKTHPLPPFNRTHHSLLSILDDILLVYHISRLRNNNSLTP